MSWWQWLIAVPVGVLALYILVRVLSLAWHKSQRQVMNEEFEHGTKSESQQTRTGR